MLGLLGNEVRIVIGIGTILEGQDSVVCLGDRLIELLGEGVEQIRSDLLQCQSFEGDREDVWSNAVGHERHAFFLLLFFLYG